MKIVFIADIVGEPGRRAVERFLPDLLEREGPAFVIANAENAAGGKGITAALAGELLSLGIHVLTLGNHAFDRKEAEAALASPRVLRPANYPPEVPGRGWAVFDGPGGIPVSIINVMGRVHMHPIDCPFRAANHIIPEAAQNTRILIVDFHAEASSEKTAFAEYLDGRVSAVIGTHTHVPTADEMVTARGTARITDAGMTGPQGGVIGMDRDTALARFLTGVPHHYAIATGTAVMQGVVVTVDDQTGRASAIRRFSMSDETV